MQDKKENNLQIYTNFEMSFIKMTDKADRIYNAIFLLTKYVSHKNMTDRLQYLGIDFLEMSYMLHPREYEHHEHVSSELTFVLKELKALTAGIVIQGILNPESKNLFDREIDMFVKSLNDYVKTYAEYYKQENGIVSPIFDTDFFGSMIDLDLPKLRFAPAPSQEKAVTEVDKKNNPQKILKDNSIGHSQLHPNPSLQRRGDSTKTSIRHSIDNSIGQKNVIQKDSRKKRIVSFIKSKDFARLSDILNHIGNCSEKTIQRELNDLIETGNIRKQGDRRWSTYFFLKDIE